MRDSRVHMWTSATNKYLCLCDQIRANVYRYTFDICV